MEKIEKKIDSIRDELLQLQVMLVKERKNHQETDKIYKNLKTASWFVGHAYESMNVVLMLAVKGE